MANNDSSKYQIRPWGNFETIYECQLYKVKNITVSSHCRTSYQFHLYRSEHLIIVSGSATVKVEDREILLKKGEHMFIDIGTKHRITNCSGVPLKIVEIQQGSIICEEDIVRIEDDYGRVG